VEPTSGDGDTGGPGVALDNGGVSTTLVVDVDADWGGFVFLTVPLPIVATVGAVVVAGSDSDGAGASVLRAASLPPIFSSSRNVQWTAGCGFERIGTNIGSDSDDDSDDDSETRRRFSLDVCCAPAGASAAADAESFVESWLQCAVTTVVAAA
jgi:hypothetical protein